MKNLFDFIVRKLSFIVLVLYVVISVSLLVNNNPYHQHVYFTSANAISSTVFDGVYNITSYVGLKTVNEELLCENANLQITLNQLNERIKEYELTTMANDSTSYPIELTPVKYIMANVIDNSITKSHNFITINKGSDDGVTNIMGVVDHNGVVGVVNTVGGSASRVISLLNMDMRLSCKIKNSDFFGSLVWDGASIYESVLEELPKHTVFNVGDTIVTSGYSQMFPAGIMVGTIATAEMSKRMDFYSVRVTLNNDFSSLGNVMVIKNEIFEEFSDNANQR